MFITRFSGVKKQKVEEIMNEEIIKQEVSEEQDLFETQPVAEEGAPEEQAVVPPKKVMNREKKRLLFYIIMIAFPILQFCVFYMYLNFSVILMAFEEYTESAGAVGYDVSYSLNNFKFVIDYMFRTENVAMIRNSLIWFVLHTFIGTLLALAFSYYIYKKYFFAEVFRVILFLPSIISSMVLVLLFKYIAEDVYIALAHEKIGLIGNPDTRFGVLIFYNLWIGFGTNILLYCGAMSGINESIVESAELDGTNSIQEFWYITLPMIYSTFTTFMVVAVSTIFTQGLNLYTFYANSAPTDIRTIGYFITVCTLQSSLTGSQGSKVYFTYSQVSALGLMITLITVPFSFGTRKLMEKYGPSAK